MEEGKGEDKEGEMMEGEKDWRREGKSERGRERGREGGWEMMMRRGGWRKQRGREEGGREA